MIVTAALAWYDEPPELLAQCVAGAANVADRIVAFDGAYARFPDAKASSPPKQAAAIRAAADAAGLECLILAPDRPWAGQVAKRSALYAMATIGSDWIAIIDADHIIAAEREPVREFLGKVREDVVDVPFWTSPPPAESNMDAVSAGNWHSKMSGTVTDVPHFLRALPQMRVERFHWWISAMRGANRVWLWGGDGEGEVAIHSPIGAEYRVEHRCLNRGTRAKQVLRNRAFCNDRTMVVERTGQEDDRPDLPRPVFDYESRLV